MHRSKAEREVGERTPTRCIEMRSCESDDAIDMPALSSRVRASNAASQQLDLLRLSAPLSSQRTELNSENHSTLSSASV
jgi:hypothetical protein